MRNRPILVLLCAALAAGPAHAQRSSSQPLREHVGTPVAYRVGIPTRWELKEDSEKLTATNGRLILVLAARDLMQKAELKLPVSPAESRRIMTTMFLGSDSLLLGLMDKMTQEISARPGARCTQLTREARELAGQHAGFVSLQCEEGGATARFDAWCTVKDGVMYVLMYAAQPRDYAANELLFTRIRESLVLAAAPPAASPD